MSVLIESRNNPKVKSLVKLQKRNEREKTGLFLIEGILELRKAVKSGYVFDSVFYCPDIITTESVKKLFGKSIPANNYEVNKEVFAKIAYRETTGGVVATAKPKQHSFDNIRFSDNPFILVLEAVEKPGNMGAIYRTADAAGVDAVIICEPRADIYNPNAIRASIGTAFSVPTVLTDTKEAIGFLKKSGINIFSTYLKASIPYHTADYTKPTAIVMGTEATGISEDWVKASDFNIVIPMSGAADSLNVSTSAAIMLFEAKRQRGF